MIINLLYYKLVWHSQTSAESQEGFGDICIPSSFVLAATIVLAQSDFRNAVT